MAVPEMVLANLGLTKFYPHLDKLLFFRGINIKLPQLISWNSLYTIPN